MKILKIYSVLVFMGGVPLGIYVAYSVAIRYGFAAAILTPLIPMLLLAPLQTVRRRTNARVSRRILAEGLQDPATMLARAGILSRLNANDLYKPYVMLEFCWYAAASFVCGVAIVVLLAGLLALQRSAAG